MLMTPAKPSKDKVIAALRTTPDRDIEVYEPVRKDDLKQLVADLSDTLRRCRDLSIVVVKNR